VARTAKARAKVVLEVRGMRPAVKVARGAKAAGNIITARLPLLSQPAKAWRAALAAASSAGRIKI
jgi:hypothetical protein